jgi:cytochrome P450
MIAGGDLTACTMYWLLAIICNMPKVQTKLQQELDSFILQNKRLPSFDDRVELRYVTSVIKETIRYNSIGPFNLPHMTKKDSKPILICIMQKCLVEVDI